MAREWTKVELYGANNEGDKRRYSIADGVSVSKGTLLYLTDPRSVSGAMLGVAPLAGVAAEDKLAGSGETSIAVYTNGIFEAVASGAINIGAGFTADSLTPNCIREAQAVASGAIVGGYVLETASADETINVRLRL